MKKARTKKTSADDGYVKFARKLAASIRRWREVEGITQVQLAARMNISRGRIAQFETARVMPTMRRLYQLAQALNVSPGQLLGGDDHYRVLPMVIDDDASVSEDAQNAIKRWFEERDSKGGQI